MNDGCNRSSGFSIEAGLAAIDDEAQARARARLDGLSELLGSCAHPLRDDSRLAFLWATERLDPSWTAQEVCHEMMCIQFICANTPYAELVQPFLRHLAEGLKRRYGLRSWGATWRIVREYGPDILKTIALVEAGVIIPNFLSTAGSVVPIAQTAHAG